MSDINKRVIFSYILIELLVEIKLATPRLFLCKKIHYNVSCWELPHTQHAVNQSLWERSCELERGPESPNESQTPLKIWLKDTTATAPFYFSWGKPAKLMLKKKATVRLVWLQSPFSISLCSNKLYQFHLGRSDGYWTVFNVLEGARHIIVFTTL